MTSHNTASREAPATAAGQSRDFEDPALYPFDGMRPQCGYVVHWAQCRLDAQHKGMHSPGRIPEAEASVPAAPKPDEALRELADTDKGPEWAEGFEEGWKAALAARSATEEG